jgi:hypothetical protein
VNAASLAAAPATSTTITAATHNHPLLIFVVFK